MAIRTVDYPVSVDEFVGEIGGRADRQIHLREKLLAPVGALEGGTGRV